MKKLFSQTVGRGPDLVLLHGWGTHSGIWQFVIKKLMQDFRVTVVDLPGFGRSKVTSDYSMDSIINLLLCVVPKRAAWIGWSMGGLIATQVAIFYPQRVTKLICVASSPKFIRESEWLGIDKSILSSFKEQLSVDYDDTFKKFLLLQFYNLSLDKNMIRTLNLDMLSYGKPKMKTLTSSLSLLEDVDLRNDLKDLRCPFLYILGESDMIVPAKLAKVLPDLNSALQVVVFTKASHALFLSHQNKFLTQVRQFFYE